MNATSSLAAGEFYGDVGEAWRTGLVTLSVVRHPMARAVPHHSHDHMFVALLLEGGYREWVGDQRIDYRPMTAVFHPEGLEHRDEITAAGSTFFILEIHPDLAGARDRRHPGLRSVRDLTGGSVVWSMLRLLETARGHRRDTLECEEPVAEILDELLGRAAPATPEPRWLGRIEAALEARYRDPVSLGGLAELAGVHPVHVARVFRRHRGCTIRSVLHRLRVLHASRLIASGQTTLAGAAIECGFCDQSHLSHVFKTVTGMTPSHYRQVVGR